MSCRLPLFAIVVLAVTRAGSAAGPTTGPATAVECLSGDAARAALVDDALEPYFATMTPAEAAAKTGARLKSATPAEQLAEIKARYQAGVRDFTDAQRAALAAYAGHLAPPLVRDYPVFGRQPWSFITTVDTLEGGMPYTRGTHIILPQRVLAQLTMMLQRAGDRALSGAASLLVHEQTHVVERLHPDLFAPLFTGTYHFVHAKRVEPNAWLTARQLENPDGVRCDWVFPIEHDGQTTYVLPLLAFDTPEPADVSGSMGTIAVDVEPAGADGAFRPVAGPDGVPRTRPLSAVTDYTAVAGRGGNNYHPNEIAADAFAQLAAVDEYLDPAARAKLVATDRGARLERQNAPVRTWAKAAFAERPSARR